MGNKKFSPCQSTLEDFNSSFCNLNTYLLSPDLTLTSSLYFSLHVNQNLIERPSSPLTTPLVQKPSNTFKNKNKNKNKNRNKNSKRSLLFSSTSLSFEEEIQQSPTKPPKHPKWLKLPLKDHFFPENNPENQPHHPLFCSATLSLENEPNPTSQNYAGPNLSDRKSIKFQSKTTLVKSLSVLERSLIGAFAGGFAGAFTYFCLHPLDTIKTKLQTKGASQIYASSFDAVVKTFRDRGILGFYSGISAVIVGSTASSAVYFGTCEFGKSVLSKLPRFPPILIPPTAGAMGNIVSSAIMVPKELITQRMQSGAATGRSWQVLLSILEKDGVLGLYAGYSATLLRNLPAGVLSYSSFEYLKSAVLSRTGKGHLEPVQSVCCGALAGAISASITTPLDVVKTRLMTQVPGEAKSEIAASVYGGISATVRQILKEEGWIGLTRGMGPRVLHSACFAAIGYFAFETARLMILHQYVSRRKDEAEPAGVSF